MRLQEIESAVTRLSPDELASFARWFDEFIADEWDKRIEADVKSGKLNEQVRQADSEFEAGRCRPL
jgi:hypothetical protein